MARDEALDPPFGFGPAARTAAARERADRHRPVEAAAPPAEADAFDPDAELVRRARAGDRVAFEALLRRHYDRMHRIAWRMTGSRQDAEDVVQDVCCNLVGRLGSFRGEARFSTWLFGVVANACRDQRRRGATLSRLKEGLAILVGLAGPSDGRDLYRRSWLASAIGRLDPGLREAVVLVLGEGLTHAEAGAALGIAEATVSWRLHEARRRLNETAEGELP